MAQKWTYEMLKHDDIVELTSIGVQFPVMAAYEDADFAEGFSKIEEEEL